MYYGVKTLNIMDAKLNGFNVFYFSMMNNMSLESDIFMFLKLHLLMIKIRNLYQTRPSYDMLCNVYFQVLI